MINTRSIKIKYKMMMAAVWILLTVIVSTVTVCADNVTLWGNLDDSSSQANLLVDAMRNDDNYDPFADYWIVRAGERDYRIYWGKDINDNNLTCIQYISQYQTQPAQLIRTTGKSLNITKNGYFYCSSDSGQPASKLVEDYKLGIVIVVAVMVILILLIFKTFRRSEHKKAKFYRVR